MFTGISGDRPARYPDDHQVASPDLQIFFSWTLDKPVSMFSMLSKDIQKKSFGGDRGETFGTLIVSGPDYSISGCFVIIIKAIPATIRIRNRNGS
jgi:hypothetical protein